MNKQETIYTGIGAGVMFGVMQSFSQGPIQGAVSGILFGIIFAYLIQMFANSRLVAKQTALPKDILLPGEQLLDSKMANLVIRPEDFGLDNFMFDGLLWVVGMKKKESLGGMLHLTNYRLLFRTHRYNRMRGMTSIFLPTVEGLEDRTVLKVFRKLAVTTGSGKVEFVVAQVPKVIKRIEAACQELDATTLTQLQQHVQNFPEKCSFELEPWTAFNKLNTVVNFGRKATNVTQVVTNPLAALSSKFIGELLDRTVTNRWQQVFQAEPREDAA